MLIELICMITFNKQSGMNWCEWKLFDVNGYLEFRLMSWFFCSVLSPDYLRMCRRGHVRFESVVWALAIGM